MNFFNIISQLAEVDSDVMGRLDSRRAVFSSLTTVGKRAAQATAPALLASFFSKAYAGTTAGDPKEVFAYALTLELLEADFYNKMLATTNAVLLPAGTTRDAIIQIAKHEKSHVDLLTAVLNGIGGTLPTGKTFKTTEFAKLTTLAAQLETAQLLEDTGVRAYKGRAGDLLGLADITIAGKVYNPLETALQIHAVEARHAAHIRYIRAQTPWIGGDGDKDGADNYKGATPESNVIQSNVNITTGLGTAYTAKDAQASFDEILTPTEVLALVTPIIGA